ncbi:hypothetical protein Ptr902_08991 [Pyrenophora tritici-repentis]|uniref:Uncharacterized protein n=1 Tax=Pyrenophora tritici-repentis TaxID=45151 RepID=A0A834W0B6_9PLEO|nr:hypothetical protein A1F99_132750 [Pyrenophora tritici-repentis]KAF7579217.1 hypothetical protein PtrM4_034570 [Pyrenophora tritici-repentis]KAI2479726.1 hypothetical protein Ptr902_08991 [Pyrenophora tritici-repentis]
MLAVSAATSYAPSPIADRLSHWFSSFLGSFYVCYYRSFCIPMVDAA